MRPFLRAAGLSLALAILPNDTGRQVGKASETAAVVAETNVITKERAKETLTAPENSPNILRFQQPFFAQKPALPDFPYKNYGPLVDVLRLQGIFFDQYTYNRITGQYGARFFSTIKNGKEYIVIDDITPDLQKKTTPKDIREKGKSLSFAERVNAVTTYRKADDDTFRKVLAQSENLLHNGVTTAENFQVEYGAEGVVSSVMLHGALYNPTQLFVPPEGLKEGTTTEVSVERGNFKFKVPLKDYFDSYRALEKRAQKPYIYYYDNEKGALSEVTNEMWFTEDAAPLYTELAQRITAAHATPTSKLIALAYWIQNNFDYFEQIDIHKTARSVFIDGGGDCKGFFVTFKTLANAVGLGHLIGGVVFEGHIAPVIKTNEGTQYQFGGEKWTVLEVATGRNTLQLGIGGKEDPKLFFLPDGTPIAATPTVTQLQMVGLSEIDQQLYAQFSKDVIAVTMYVENPNNLPAEDSLMIAGLAFYELEPLVTHVHASYIEILRHGKIAGPILQSWALLGKKTDSFIKKWETAEPESFKK